MKKQMLLGIIFSIGFSTAFAGVSSEKSASEIKMSRKEMIAEIKKKLPVGIYQGENCRVNVENRDQNEESIYVTLTRLDSEGAFGMPEQMGFAIYAANQDIRRLYFSKEGQGVSFNIESNWAMEPGSAKDVFVTTLQIDGRTVRIGPLSCWL